MKKTFNLIGLTLGVGLVLLTACNKDDSSCGEPSTCYTCTNCQGQYGHLINGEKCVDGFDNCEDWKNAKTTFETEDGCDCAYN